MALALLAAALPATAASSAEKRAYQAAVNLFHDGFWEFADRDLSAFLQLYPTSDQRTEALLLQAQAQFHLKKFDTAVALLETNIPSAGPLRDEYLFWTAEALFASKDFLKASAAYATLLASYPQSARRLEAILGEAYCHFNLDEFDKVWDLLGTPQGEFQKAVREKPANKSVVLGALLLSETSLLTRNFKAGEDALNGIATVALQPDDAWRRSRLLCQILVAAGKPQEALEEASRLKSLAAAGAQKSRLAEVVALQAGILEQLHRPEEALKTYEANLFGNADDLERQQALVKTIELTLQLGRNEEAIAKLEQYAKQFPTDDRLDLVWLTLGELRLKEYLRGATSVQATNLIPVGTNALVETNRLQAAQNNFARLVTDFPQSAYVGKACLNRAWCQWLMTNIDGCQSSFRQAIERLPVSGDRAVAVFKLGDTYLWQKDYTNALAQYRRVLADYGQDKQVRQELLDQALYQTLHTAVQLRDLPTATNALARLQEWFPDSYYSQRSLLLLGTALNRVDQPAKARQLFEECLKTFPASAPMVDLMIARTYVQERDWAAAVRAYDAWSKKHGGAALQPQAEFDRALAHYQAGSETNALNLFTNFVARFPANPLAASAQFWIASFHFRNGNYDIAERNCQNLFQNTNWPATELTYQARLMAGRAALGRQNSKDAIGYFTNVVNDLQCPPEIVAEALFALGDTYIEEPQTGAEKLEDKIKDALGAFQKIPQNYATSRLVPAAWGRLGNCYLQLATVNPSYYTNAAEHYQKAMGPAATVTVRSQAEVGLGLVCEQQARLLPEAQRGPVTKDALLHYLNVFYGKNLKDGEASDSFWVAKAGLAAATLAESDQNWDSAEAIYQKLETFLPSLRETIDRRRKALQELREQK